MNRVFIVAKLCALVMLCNNSALAQHYHHENKPLLFVNHDAVNRIRAEDFLSPEVQTKTAAYLERYVASLSREVQTAFPQAASVWPNADFSNVTIAFTDGAFGWLVGAEGTHALSKEEIAKVYIKEAGFGCTTIEGKNAVFINATSVVLFYRLLAYAGPPPSFLFAEEFLTGGKPFAQGLLVQELKSHWHSKGIETEITLPVRRNGATRIFSFAAHEAFHEYVQYAWQKNFLSADNSIRHERYPLRHIPRAQRALVQGYLMNSPPLSWIDTNSLAKAVFWHEQWKKSYPKDYNKALYTDVIEGTAQYFDMNFEALTVNGGIFLWPEKERYLATFPLEHSIQDSALMHSVKLLRNSADDESYLTGAIAGKVLDHLNVEWKANAEKFVRPMDVLAQNIRPQPPRSDNIGNEMLKIAKRYIAREQEYIAKFIDPFLAKISLTDDDQLFVIFSAAKTKGSFRTRGFYVAETRIGDISMTVDMTATASNGENTIFFKSITLGEVDRNNPCDQGTKQTFPYFTIVKESDLTRDGNTLLYSAENLSFEGHADNSNKTTFRGMNALCLR